MTRSEAIQAIKTRTAPSQTVALALSMLADHSRPFTLTHYDGVSLGFVVGTVPFGYLLTPDRVEIDHPLGRYRSVPGYDLRGRRCIVETFLGSTWYPCWPSIEIHDALLAATSALGESKPAAFDRVVSPTTTLDDLLAKHPLPWSSQRNAIKDAEGRYINHHRLTADVKSEEVVSATKTANSADPYVELTGNLGGAKVLVPRSSLPCEIRLLNYGFDKCGTVSISGRGNVYACMRSGRAHDDPISIGLRDGRPIEAVMVSRS